MNEKLKHCPFCGGKAQYEYQSDSVADGEHWVMVQCQSCCANSGYFQSEQSATEAWNTRVDDKDNTD